MRHLIVGFSDKQAAMAVRQILLRRGLPVTAISFSGAQILQQASFLQDGGVVICPYRLADMTARELLHLLPDTFDLLVLATPDQQGMLIDPGMYTLTAPINPQQLLTCTRQLLETRQITSGGQSPVKRQQQTNQQKRTGPADNRTPQEQKLIEQAKYLLMNRRHCSEDEAHRYLQKKSMETGARLVDVAYWVINPKNPEP